MNHPNKSDNYWIEDLTELIRKKKEENEILKKLGESLSHPGKTFPMNQPAKAKSHGKNKSNDKSMTR
jgi:hypothetical protein